MTVSALYLGHVMHQRHAPRPHGLRYRMFQMLIDLDELPALDGALKHFSRNRLNLFSVFDKDHGLSVSPEVHERREDPVHGISDFEAVVGKGPIAPVHDDPQPGIFPRGMSSRQFKMDTQPSITAGSMGNDKILADALGIGGVFFRHMFPRP